MPALLALWTHMLAAILFAALSVWQLRHWNSEPLHRPLVAAFAVMALWGVFTALAGAGSLQSAFSESARNIAFLFFMYGIAQDADEDGERQRGVKLVFGAVAAVIGLQIAVGGVIPEAQAGGRLHATLLSTGYILGLTVAAGALVLVHNLYGQAAPEARAHLRLPAIALAVMWGYDLHYYTTAYLTRAAAQDLFAMRGAAAALMVPLFALGLRRGVSWRLKLSRAATFQSLSLLAILVYLILMMIAVRAAELAGAEWVRIAQVGFMLALSVAVLVFLPSPRARAWLRVFVAKHLFEHRYDYRAEWLRFTRTIGLGESGAMEARVVKALAELGGAPGARLFLVDGQRLVAAAHWNWPGEESEGGGASEAFTAFLAAHSHVIDFARLADPQGAFPAAPDWLVRLPCAWAGVPLVHAGRLIGLVVLQPPGTTRLLDWEDFDLFRAAGMQAASYLAEAMSQQALSETQRFEEFNRRFAFVAHDIKNLVSQISLVARNAERHAENPEFRADMIATLQSSVKKMNDLLARLTRGRSGEGEPPRAVPLRPIVDQLAATRRRSHPVEVSGDPAVWAVADPVRLEQALAHLLANAVEASVPSQAVTLRTSRGEDGQVLVEIADQGRGMSPDFVRTRLFQPFASTKPDGFGIGAYEARALVQGMGGCLDVISREGEGTRFVITLPAANPSVERLRA